MQYKFRAWLRNAPHPHMIYDDKMCIEDFSTLEQVLKYWSEGADLMPYINMKDSNGKEIYLHDIVKIPEDTHLKIVEWKEEGACFVLRGLPDEEYSEMFYMEEPSEIVVVGNDYEGVIELEL